MAKKSAVSPTRREFVFGGAAAATLLAAGSDSALAADAQVRPDIASPAGQRMVQLYAAAVEAMQNPAINYPPQPQSWTFQSYIHAVPANPFDPGNSAMLATDAEVEQRVNQIYGTPAAGSPQAAWKDAALQCWARCEHSSPYFTVWHRWYLFMFERICRRMCNDASFMLPYWNYASDAGPSLQMPAQFRNPPRPASGNPPLPSRLVFSGRGVGHSSADGSGAPLAMNDGGHMLLSDIAYGQAFETRAMFPADSGSDDAYAQLGFSGRLEIVPHDMVHGAVGGWMVNPASASGDPIFYVHHCQIDRLVASWEALTGVSYNWGSGGASPPQSAWMARQSPFVDETGRWSQRPLAVANSIGPFGYRYDNLVNPQRLLVARRGLPRLPSSPVELAALQSGQFTVSASNGAATLAPAPGAATAAIAHGRPAILMLEGITLLKYPPAPLGVFVNLPRGAPPNPAGPYYVGTLNLFKFTPGGGAMTHRGTDRSMTMQPSDVRFDVTDVLLNQRATDLWNGDSVTVTIAARVSTRGGDESYLAVRRARLAP